MDLDGTICSLRQSTQSYDEVKPIPGAIAALKKLKEEGHEIIIYTARNMKTYQGNTGKAVANIGGMTIDWLRKYQVPYDEIIFGKPQGDLYIDDLAIPFTDWNLVMSHSKLKVCT